MNYDKDKVLRELYEREVISKIFFVRKDYVDLG